MRLSQEKQGHVSAGLVVGRRRGLHETTESLAMPIAAYWVLVYAEILSNSHQANTVWIMVLYPGNHRWYLGIFAAFPLTSILIHYTWQGNRNYTHYRCETPHKRKTELWKSLVVKKRCANAGKITSIQIAQGPEG